MFHLENMSLITALSNGLKVNTRDAIYVCLPSIYSRILTDYCKKNHGRTMNSSSLNTSLFDIVPNEVCKKAVVERIDEFIVNLLLMIEETGNYHMSSCSVCSDDAYISAEEFSTVVSYLLSYVEYDSIGKCLNHKADSIQSIFLALNIQLCKSLRSHDSRRILCMYQNFLHLILSNLKELSKYGSFMINEVVYSLINFLNNRKNSGKDEMLVEYCSDIILLLCKETIQCFRETIGELLSFIVSNLIPFVNESRSGKKVLNLLQYLIDDCEEYLIQYIPYLNPFPSDRLFTKLSIKHKHIKYKHGKLSLEKEIRFFLISCQMMGKATKIGLEYLCEQLKSRKTEFQEILNALKGQILFTEDVEKSIIHELICLLASYCSSNFDAEIQKAASYCLGAIGPVAFSSVVLQPSSHAVMEKGHEDFIPLQRSYAVILNMLAKYIFDKRIHIKEAASSVLKDIFSTKIGYIFFKEYSKLLPNSNIVKHAFPYFVCQRAKEVRSACKYQFNLDSLLPCVWLPGSSGHSQWITNLVCTILECGLTRNNFYECLVPICKEQTSFCEKIIPYVVHLILLMKEETVLKTLSAGISSFFSQCSAWIKRSNSSKEDFSSPTTSAEFSKDSVKTMLSVLHYIWLHPNYDEKVPRNMLKNLWLNINYLEVAQAAQYCSAHFTAILYTELWCDVKREQNRESTPPNSFESGDIESSPLSFMSSEDPEKVSSVYDILLDAYSHIDDSDAICGCDIITADSRAILKHSYLTEKKWDGLLKLSDKQNCKLETLQALQLTGLNNVLLGYSQSLLNNRNDMQSQDILEYQCQAAWRMSQWDLSVSDSSSSHGFQECFYKCQQNYVTENKPMFDKYLGLARKTLFDDLNNTSLESAKNVLPILSNMQLLSTLEDVSRIQNDSVLLRQLLETWNHNNQVPYEDFKYIEPICWLQCILLKHQVDLNSSKHIVVPHLKNLLLDYCVNARDELFIETAHSAVNLLRQLPLIEEKDKLQWQIEEAKILWTSKECSIANKILKSSLHFIEKSTKDNPELVLSYGEALTLRGKWLAETCSENSTVIMRDYLEKAVSVLENCDSPLTHQKSSARWDAYLAVARFADSQYQSIVNYKKSTAYQTKLAIMESSKKEAKKLNSKSVTEDQRKTILILTKQFKIDQEELNSLDLDQKQFLNKAINSYLKCLRGTDAHDLWVFRLISLWFQNQEDEETNNIIQTRIQELQTYKFLPLMYQLAARMSSQASSFQSTLTNLIIQITIDHPHHSLPVILALSNADKDPVDGLKKSGPSLSQQSDVTSVKERMDAAKKIISLLTKTKVGPLVKGYTDLGDAYIALAYMPVDKKTKKAPIPSDQPLLKFKGLNNIPVITEEVKVDRSCEYKNIIGIHSFNSEFRMCGGITLPKVIKCLGIDGIEREQLVKGRDDLRQDAVMQQVFNLVNLLLDKETETKRRQLHIRTYKVVPMSRRSGVIQWCEGTQVLSQYLVGNQGAHARYYPHMASHIDCRKKMETIASLCFLHKKREIFDDICLNFPPVFRYFFLEHFPEPSAWFERRLCYTRSVAASSIVGYILGLGDRHVNNILIDKNTAEVVHIDFGIAFEKGKILATPETVPFRLTRDIVDGMGISGIEGTFKRCSEKTLEVMRKAQDILLTILDVLIHDPLYEWTVSSSKSPSQASKIGIEDKDSNKLAERALMRLQQKLQGLEEGVAMSIEGQVNLLIQAARDPNNLCRLYAGWQPYL